MSLPGFLRFDPVPLRAQHNGWTPALQLRFVLALARGAGPDEAARALGRTRQSVYRLRKKARAEAFATAWDDALAFARSAAAAGRSPVAGLGGIDTILVPRTYRGRLIGFVQREDIGGAVRVLARLDRLAGVLAALPTRSRRAKGWKHPSGPAAREATELTGKRHEGVCLVTSDLSHTA
jgi:hypothetical protein